MRLSRMAVTGGVAYLVAAGVAVSATTTDPAVSYADPAWSADGKKIAFVEQHRQDGGTFASLVVMRSDGTGRVTLTPREHRLGWPSWSPNGRRIAFQTSGCSIFVVDANGARRRAVVGGKDGCGLYADWSPGGRKIAYTAPAGDTDAGNIMVMNPDGSRKVEAAVSDGTFAAYKMPTWSPDGERLAFRQVDAPDSANHSTPALAYIRQYGGSIRRLSATDADEPDWAPDGRRIVYSALIEQRQTIRSLNLATSRTLVLHTGSHPRWSHDGRRIVFADGGRIYTMNADGTHVAQLTR